MADKRIVDLTLLAVPPAAGDFIAVTDVSDITDSPQGTDKRLAISNLGLAGFTSQSVIFAGATGALAEDNANFKYDSVSNQFVVNSHIIFGSSVATTSGNDTSITGGRSNLTDGDATHIGGGSSNAARGDFSVVGGGLSNEADGANSVVSGGTMNVALAVSSNIGGGSTNTINIGAMNSSIGGGIGNSITAVQGAHVGGGETNIASGRASVVSGGEGSQSLGARSAVGGGLVNFVSGDFGTIPGGNLNTVTGDYGFAAGRRAKSNHAGTFIWSDSIDADFSSTAINQWRVQADNGIEFHTTNYLAVNGASSLDSLFTVNSTTQGVKLSVMTDAQMEAIVSPTLGLEGFNSDWKSPFWYDGNVFRAPLSAPPNTVSVAFADSPVTLSAGTDVLLCDTTLGNITVNLPAAALFDRVPTIKKTAGANTVIIEPNLTEIIDNQATLTLAGSNPLPSAVITSDGVDLWLL